MFKTHPQNTPFTLKKTRSQFITKVFSIVGTQLFLTALLIILIRQSSLLTTLTNYLVLPSLILGLISLIALSCNKSLSRKVPTNYTLLFVITFAESLGLEVFLRVYNLDAILVSVFVTGFTVALMGGIAMYSKVEFMSSRFFAYLIFGHLAFLVFNLFFFRFEHVVFSFVSAFVTCAYVVVDIQVIMGDHSRKLSVDDYVMGALMLYLDIIILFKRIVEIFGEKDKKKKN